MVKRRYLAAISLAAAFLIPSAVLSETYDEFDQFTDALTVGIFQGIHIYNDLEMISENDGGTTQGLNVIYNYAPADSVVQKAVIDENLSLTMSGGDNVVQGVNVYRGEDAEEIAQMAFISGTLTMHSAGNNGGIQGINIITTKEF